MGDRIDGPFAPLMKKHTFVLRKNRAMDCAQTHHYIVAYSCFHRSPRIFYGSIRELTKAHLADWPRGKRKPSFDMQMMQVRRELEKMIKLNLLARKDGGLVINPDPLRPIPDTAQHSPCCCIQRPFNGEKIEPDTVFENPTQQIPEPDTQVDTPLSDATNEKYNDNSDRKVEVAPQPDTANSRTRHTLRIEHRVEEDIKEDKELSSPKPPHGHVPPDPSDLLSEPEGGAIELHLDLSSGIESASEPSNKDENRSKGGEQCRDIPEYEKGAESDPEALAKMIVEYQNFWAFKGRPTQAERRRRMGEWTAELIALGMTSEIFQKRMEHALNNPKLRCTLWSPKRLERISWDHAQKDGCAFNQTMAKVVWQRGERLRLESDEEKVRQLTLEAIDLILRDKKSGQTVSKKRAEELLRDFDFLAYCRSLPKPSSTFEAPPREAFGQSVH